MLRQDCGPKGNAFLSITVFNEQVLNAIQNSYKREHYRNDPYCVFYVDWLKKYRAGGGPLPIADELLEKGTRKQLAEAFVSVRHSSLEGY